ncbi:MAG: LON peptidase substrate-binding domain-containing protein [Bdellovibrionales bacterium]
MSIRLPNTLPLLCLSGAILLPHLRLPLNIFEPRYLNMISHALGKDRMIGMIQPIKTQETQKHPPLYKIGCAGKIVTFAESEDGRFLITLSGISRFTLTEETISSTFRIGTVDYSSFKNDLLPIDKIDFSRPRLIALLRPYFASYGVDADWSLIEASDDEELISSLCLSCPFESSEKQALLEAPSFAERTETLIALLEMANLRRDNGERAKH